jgi:hypothetical protein
MVSIIGSELLHERKYQLYEALKGGLEYCRPHSLAFVLRVLSTTHLEHLQSLGVNFSTVFGTHYGGYPEVASLGFLIANNALDTQLSARFIESLNRLKIRDTQANRPFFSDDVAILGVADGLSKLPFASEEKRWLLDGIESIAGNVQWSSRMRSLALDLLQERGRLRVAVTDNSADVISLEIVLRRVWPHLFNSVNYVSHDLLKGTLSQLLSDKAPSIEEQERVVIWLEALDYIIDASSESLLPTVSDTVRILKNIEHSFKRWKWETTARKGAAFASQWLIDNEYDVQAVLWAVLYPVYGADLVDESYLPNWGQTQPRADLGIQKLKLIIEVKFLRSLADFQKVEGEIGNDVGLYFKDMELYDRMVVVIYDDCDNHQPQKYDGLRNALKKRDHIEDVIMIRRPGMLPSRKDRRIKKTRPRQST